MAYFMIIFFIIIVIFPHLVHSNISFKINDFSSSNDDDGSSNGTMVYSGNAEPLNHSIKFKDKAAAGWATYAHEFHLWNQSTAQISDFTTHFSFLISNLGDITYGPGDGLAFFLAPVGARIPTNSSGGYLGLFNTTAHNESFHNNKIVHIEFDTFPNLEWDPPFQHVGINIHSISSFAQTLWNSSSTVTQHHDQTDVWISYNASAKNLSVLWSSKDRKHGSSLFHSIELMKFLPEWVTVGFSASTCHYSIVFWEFESNLAARVNENGISSNSSSSESSINMRLEAVLIAWFAVLIIIAIVITFRNCAIRNVGVKEKTLHEVKLASIYTDLNKGESRPRRFSYKYLALATDNFSMDRKLGQGGFGDVFKGHLPGTNKTVAVKKISRGSSQGKREYINEVKIISRMNHENLLQLIGWCHDGVEFLVVYEFMENGSLDSQLFCKTNLKPPLPWSLRFKISRGLAYALLYLHEECGQCVVHRDIKSSNVLLDSDFNPKLGDFGLASRVVDNEQPHAGLAGTFGYMAPEYIRTGRASKESDIFSYGVVLLEILTGKKSTDHGERESGKGLVEFVWDVYGKGEVFKVCCNEKLQIDDFELRQMECLCVVGLWCAHPDPIHRPSSIQKVINVLNFEMNMPNLPLKMPVPIFQ